MHILLANQWFPPESGWGGVSLYNWVMAHAFRELGHEVTVVASRVKPEPRADYKVDGIRVYRIPVRDPYHLRRLPGIGRYVRPFHQLLYSRRVKQQIERIHRERPVDVVEFAEVNAEGFFYARAPRTPFVVRCHTPTFLLRQYYGERALPYDTRITSWCERDLIRRACVVTAPSSDLAHRVRDECGLANDSVAVIPNALSVSAFADPTEAQSAAKPPTILYVGRFEYAKGIGVLLQAIPRVLQQAPTARFILVGYDRRMGESVSQGVIEKRMNELRVHGQVDLIGQVEQSEMAAWYGRADICVVPSVVYESFSYTCAQAMAAGKPVVASRIGGIPETVEDSIHGLLVEPGNAEQLANAIVLLARDLRLREEMGRAGRKRVEGFEPRNVAQENIRVYERAIARFGEENESRK